MYKFDNGQISLEDFEQPVGMHLKNENRWVKKAQTIPWNKIEKRYAKLFSNKKGNVAKSLRLGLGACIIQAEYKYSDEEIVLQIQENPYLELYKKQPITKARIQEYFSGHTLNELNTAMEDIHIPDEDTFIECNERFQDLSVNYHKEGLYTAFLKPLLTEACKYSNIYSQSDNNYMSRSLQTSQKHFCSLLTDYDIIFRNYLANELFSDLISPETASTKKIVEQMIIKMQWIMIEYTAIRQSLFLWYSHNANSPLTYETIREHIVIISRMTGYDDDDIREYLENSFTKLIWDWGYAALIMGIRK